MSASKAISLTQRRVAQVAAEIRQVGRTARQIDPAAGFSYAAMTGGLQSVLQGLVRDLAGTDAEKLVEAAFKDTYPDEDERVTS